MSTAQELDIETVEARLKLLDAEMERLYESVPFGSYSVANDGTYSQINALELTWLEFTREELIGKRKPIEFLCTASQHKFEKHLELFGVHGFADLELVLVSQFGKTRPISLSMNGFTDAAGNPQRNRFVTFPSHH